MNHNRNLPLFKRCLWTLAIASLLLSASLAQAQGQRPDCYVLSVGIDRYPQSPLKGCVNDARNMASLFSGQKGKLFEKVTVSLLLDDEGSRASIREKLNSLAGSGKEGDFVVIFLSGHGGNQAGKWHFVPHDHTGDAHTQLTDTTLLGMADALAGEGKKVLIIVDACYAGQLRLNAREQLNKKHPDGGGVVLMVSSMPKQVSNTIGGQYSAFAQAVFEGLSGHADLDGDGFITLREVRRYAYHRVHDIHKKGDQDGEIDYSLSVSENLRLTAGSKNTAPAVAAVPGSGSSAPAAPAAPGGNAKILQGELTAQVATTAEGRHYQAFDVPLKAGTPYTIDLMSSSFDTYLILADAQGKVLAEDDDGGEGLNSRIRFTAPASGKYSVIVTTFNKGDMGPFTVSVAEGNGPAADGPAPRAPAAPAAPGQAAGLAGSSFAGEENLKGYGKLRFEFHANGQATMHDTRGQTPGTWVQKGQAVTLRFGNTCSYQGTLQNGSLSGSATNVCTTHNRCTTWSWKTDRE